MAKRTPKSLRPLIRRGLVQKPWATRMDRADRQYLVDFYREDILKLAGLLGRNLDGWLRGQSEASPRIQQGAEEVRARAANV